MSSNQMATSVERTIARSHLLAGAATPFATVNPLGLSGWLNDVQGVRIDDRGYATTKFSTRLGPPPSSPPV